MSFFRAAGISAFILLANVTVSRAAWPSDPAVNVALTTVPFEHLLPEIATDGAGGAIICWQDFRSVQTWDDIYVQRIGQGGAIAWTPEGVVVCAAPYVQADPRLASDDGGGVIVAWKDGRSNVNFDVFAQRIDANGSAAWTSDGVPVAVAAGNQDEVQVMSDAAGGAFVVWTDYRSGNADIYAQRLTGSGAPLWTPNGVAICANAFDQVTPQLERDGAGGIIVIWIDRRNLGVSSDDLYGQRISSTGLAQWTLDGIAVAERSGPDRMHQLVSDGIGGVIVCWSSSAAAGDIYAQRVTAGGVMSWTIGGVDICVATGSQIFPQSVGDGEGGAFICWSDNRPSAGGIYAQRVNASGSTTWLANGAPVTTAQNSQDRPQLVSDGQGGIIVAWEDARNVAFEPDIYAQRLSASGTEQWTPGGVPVSIADDWQWIPVLVADATGGAIIAWEDERVGEYDVHIYAQQVGSDGQLGDISTDIKYSGAPRYSLSIVPNPTSGAATLRFAMPRAATAVVEVFSVTGQLVFRDELGRLPDGSHVYSFQGRSADGAPLPSGIYLCRVATGSHTMIQKLAVLH